MTERRAPIVVDPSDLTLSEYGELEEALGSPLETLLEGSGKWRAIAGMAWIIQRRSDPTYELADAFSLRMGEVQLVTPETAEGFPQSGPGGAPPPASPAPGP